MRFADVGAPLEELRQGLIASCRELAGDARAMSSDTAATAELLQRLTCKIAVIGQVKAGKSSFISALIGRPHLLPSDANPWTTVVTSLHFHYRVPPSESAVFTFFNGDEWRRIAEGGGPLRELTERLVPGFDPGLLGAQLDAMRRRAEQRLGPSFAGLLGQSQSFPRIDRETLDRYVSAGQDGIGVSTGWFSDVTKAADLYFGSERRGLPLTLVDTPGTNDPLLVRDEITRLNVSSGELFVVMLTAQQPLSGADISLLRLLRGLRKDQIIVFLNRIDGLPDIAQQLDRVVRHVEERLEAEFPGVRLPVVVGSALWASVAVAGTDAEVEATLGPAARGLAALRGLDLPDNVDEARSALLSLSGIPQVTAAIDRALLSGAAAHELRRQCQALLQLAQSGEETHTGQAIALQRAVLQSRANVETRAAHLQAWREELDQLDTASRQLQQNLEFYESSLAAIVKRCGEDLHQLLGASLTRFVEQELDDLSRSHREKREKVWRCDPAPLRKELQQEFLRIYGYWEGMLHQVDTQIMTQLRAIMPSFGSGAGAASVELPDSPLSEPPSFTPLSRPLAFDLSVPWWRSWWSSRPRVEDLSIRLERLLQGEFGPLIDDLIGAATGTLAEHTRLAGRQARLCTLDIIEGIRRRSRELVAGLQDGAAGPSTTTEQLEQELRATEARAKRLGIARARLSTLMARCNSMGEGRADT